METGAESRFSDEGQCCAQAIPLREARLPLRKRKTASGHDRNAEHARKNPDNPHNKRTRSDGARMG